MMVPTPIFASEDWSVVWLWPTIMAGVFSLFLRGRHRGEDGEPRPVLQRFLANFLLFASFWVPSEIIGGAVERGAEAQGLGSPLLWGLGVGLPAGAAVFAALLVVIYKIQPVRTWVGFNRNPFRSAGKP